MWLLRRHSNLSQHNHDWVQDSVNIRIVFTSAAMYPVTVMFIVTTADRVLTTLPDVVQNQISRMLRPRTYVRFAPTKNGERPLKYTTVRNLYSYHESTILLQVTCCLNLIFYEWIGTLFHISLALVWHACTSWPGFVDLQQSDMDL